jgi:hypothetical protein
MRALSFGFLFVALLAAPALAQSGYGAPPPPPAQPTPWGVKGTVVNLSGDVLTVKSNAGETVQVHISDKTGISAHAKRTLADIKPGDFVGSAAVPGPNGKLVAQEVHIFPEALRGTYEGHHDMPGGDPGRTMTNASVSGIAGATNGTTLTLKYPDGQQDIVVGPDVPVFAIVPGDRTWLTPGMAVSAFGQKAADGTITAFGVFVEHDGQKPLM